MRLREMPLEAMRPQIDWRIEEAQRQVGGRTRLVEFWRQLRRQGYNPAMPLGPNTNLIRLFNGLAVAILLAAVFDMPYGYYTLVRLVVTLVALFTAWHAVALSRSPLWVGVMGLIAILFNPVVPVFLPRETWFFIDLTVAATLMLYAVTLPRRSN